MNPGAKYALKAHRKMKAIQAIARIAWRFHCYPYIINSERLLNQVLNRQRKRIWKFVAFEPSPLFTFVWFPYLSNSSRISRNYEERHVVLIFVLKYIVSEWSHYVLPFLLLCGFTLVMVMGTFKGCAKATILKYLLHLGESYVSGSVSG
jgi:hypothetical protein